MLCEESGRDNRENKWDEFLLLSPSRQSKTVCKVSPKEDGEPQARWEVRDTGAERPATPLAQSATAAIVAMGFLTSW